MLDINILNKKSHVPKLVKFLVCQEAFTYEWSREDRRLLEASLNTSLHETNHQYWYVEDGDSVIAVIGIRENKHQNGGYELDDDYLAVHEQYRRHRLGSRLLNEVEKFVRDRKGRYIHILTYDTPDYAPARFLYEKNGYRKVAEIPNYYSEGEGRIDFFKKF